MQTKHLKPLGHCPFNLTASVALFDSATLALISAQMSSVKRKMPNLGGLQRRVRPRVEPEPESDIQDSDSQAPSEEDVTAGSGSEDDDDNDDDDDGDGSDISDDGGSVTPPSPPYNLSPEI